MSNQHTYQNEVPPPKTSEQHITQSETSWEADGFKGIELQSLQSPKHAIAETDGSSTSRTQKHAETGRMRDISEDTLVPLTTVENAGEASARKYPIQKQSTAAEERGQTHPMGSSQDDGTTGATTWKNLSYPNSMASSEENGEYSSAGQKNTPVAAEAPHLKRFSWQSGSSSFEETYQTHSTMSADAVANSKLPIAGSFPCQTGTTSSGEAEQTPPTVNPDAAANSKLPIASSLPCHTGTTSVGETEQTPPPPNPDAVANSKLPIDSSVPCQTGTTSSGEAEQTPPTVKPSTLAYPHLPIASSFARENWTPGFGGDVHTRPTEYPHAIENLELPFASSFLYPNLIQTPASGVDRQTDPTNRRESILANLEGMGPLLERLSFRPQSSRSRERERTHPIKKVDADPIYDPDAIEVTENAVEPHSSPMSSIETPRLETEQEKRDRITMDSRSGTTRAIELQNLVEVAAAKAIRTMGTPSRFDGAGDGRVTDGLGGSTTLGTPEESNPQAPAATPKASNRAHSTCCTGQDGECDLIACVPCGRCRGCCAVSLPFQFQILPALLTKLGFVDEGYCAV